MRRPPLSRLFPGGSPWWRHVARRGRTLGLAATAAALAVTLAVAGVVVSATRPPKHWVPPATVTWQWQLSGRLDPTVDVQVFDVDLFETTAAQVRDLHSRGRRVICYLNAGAWEPDRPDSDDFPASVRGQALDGWPDEQWLDIRRQDVLLPLIAARMDLCKRKGFDAVEPDNVDAYENDSGFPLTARQQLSFNRAVAALAHQRGLAVALKNDLDQVPQLVRYFDFAVNEECAANDECEELTPFVAARKPVLHVEYDLSPGEFCSATRALGFSSMRKPLALGRSRTPC